MLGQVDNSRFVFLLLILLKNIQKLSSILLNVLKYDNYSKLQSQFISISSGATAASAQADAWLSFVRGPCLDIPVCLFGGCSPLWALDWVLSLSGC